MSSIWGRMFTVSTWGESHGKAIGVVIDGCPSGLELSECDIQAQLDKRRPGQSKLTTMRKESDKVEILSGLFEGKTTGTPISMIIKNEDSRSQDYSEMVEWYRPSHADYTYDQKYGFRDYRGGGRASARETATRVAAGAVARKILLKDCGIKILAYVSQIGTISCNLSPVDCSHSEIEANLVRCPDPVIAKKMEEAILDVKKNQNSLGGIIQLVIKNVPPGFGEPIFHRLEADLAQAMLSIPATKGFEIGSGFAGTCLKGSEHNDPFIMEDGKIKTQTNNSGGIQGGISNGMPILARVAFKPVATIAQSQNTVNAAGQTGVIRARGRHDPCVVPRAVVIVESMAALTLVNFYLEHRVRMKNIS